MAGTMSDVGGEPSRWAVGARGWTSLSEVGAGRGGPGVLGACRLEGCGRLVVGSTATGDTAHLFINVDSGLGRTSGDDVVLLSRLECDWPAGEETRARFPPSPTRCGEVYSGDAEIYPNQSLAKSMQL